jgi:hypothetical protein
LNVVQWYPLMHQRNWQTPAPFLIFVCVLVCMRACVCIYFYFDVFLFHFIFYAINSNSSKSRGPSVDNRSFGLRNWISRHKEKLLKTRKILGLFWTRSKIIFNYGPRRWVHRLYIFACFNNHWRMDSLQDI